MGAGELFLQIGQFLRVQQSIDLLNAHGAQIQADDYGQVALFPEQDSLSSPACPCSACSITSTSCCSCGESAAMAWASAAWSPCSRAMRTAAGREARAAAGSSY